MAWVVDSCVILDIAENDPHFGSSSANCVVQHLSDGVVACPVSVVEIVPRFGGDLVPTREFLRECGIACGSWLETDTEEAAKGWATYVAQKRAGQSAKRPLADVLIGGFASRYQGLITRNAGHFRPYFPDLAIVEAQEPAG